MERIDLLIGGRKLFRAVEVWLPASKAAAQLAHTKTGRSAALVGGLRIVPFAATYLSSGPNVVVTKSAETV